jgi:RNA polymerase sigma-70 factor, ECF subfamily
MTRDKVAKLYIEHERLVTAVAWRILRSVEDAREVAQEAFTRLLAATEPIRNPRAWLARTAINLSINRRRRHPPPPPKIPAESRLEDRALLEEALNDLSEQQRVVFLLRHEQGLPIAEIAEFLSVAPSTVGVHLTRALRALRDRLSKEWP